MMMNLNDTAVQHVVSLLLFRAGGGVSFRVMDLGYCLDKWIWDIIESYW